MKIITFYDQPRFAEGAALLGQSLTHWNWGNHLAVYEKLPPGCPSHAESPFAFKPHLLDRERRQGVELVLWADTSIRFMSSPDWVVDQIEQHGYLLIEDTDQLLRWWSSDRALDFFGLNRTDLNIHHDLSSGFLGLDFRHRVAHEFLDAWLESEKAGLFPGAWSNDDRSVSSGLSVKGHRHDQTCATLIARQMRLQPSPYREVGVASWPDYADICDTARVIVDRGRSCPQVSAFLNSQTRAGLTHTKTEPSNPLSLGDSLPLACIVPCKGRLELLRRMIPKLLAQSDLPDYRVLVVDYGCPDGTFEWCQEQKHPRLDCVKVLDGTDRFNASRSRNCGVRLANSQMIVTLDSDCVLGTRSMLRRMVEPLLASEADLSHVTLTQQDGSIYPAHICLAYYRDSWLAVGGYDEKMTGWGYEDTDFFDRLKACGHCQELEADHNDFYLIDHANNLRVQFYEEKSIDESWRENCEWASRREGVNLEGFASFEYIYYRGDSGQTIPGHFTDSSASVHEGMKA